MGFAKRQKFDISVDIEIFRTEIAQTFMVPVDQVQYKVAQIIHLLLFSHKCNKLGPNSLLTNTLNRQSLVQRNPKHELLSSCPSVHQSV